MCDEHLRQAAVMIAPVEAFETLTSDERIGIAIMHAILHVADRLDRLERDLVSVGR